MKYSKIFKGNMDGPYKFFYEKGAKEHRLCYIINGYHSGLFNVYCPSFYSEKDREVLSEEFNLAKSNSNETEFFSYGSNNYLN